jgi:hypothetical protein
MHSIAHTRKHQRFSRPYAVLFDRQRLVSLLQRIKGHSAAWLGGKFLSQGLSQRHVTHLARALVTLRSPAVLVVLAVCKQIMRVGRAMIDALYAISDRTPMEGRNNAMEGRNAEGLGGENESPVRLCLPLALLIRGTSCLLLWA